MKAISSLLALSLPLLCFQAGLTQADTFLDAAFGDAKCNTPPMMMAMTVNDEKCIPGTCAQFEPNPMSRFCVKDEKTGLQNVKKLYNKTPYIRVDLYNKDCKQRYPETTFLLANGSCIPMGPDTYGTFKLDARAKTLTAKMYANAKCQGTAADTKTLAEKDFGNACVDGSKVYGSIASNITSVGPNPVPRPKDEPQPGGEGNGENQPLVATVYYASDKCTSNAPDSIWFEDVLPEVCETTASVCKTARKGVGAKPQCVHGIAGAIGFTTEQFAKSKKDFAVVQFFPSKSKCDAEPQTAILRADNSCVVGKVSTSSYKVSYNKKEQSISFTSYANGNCSGKGTTFKVSKTQQATGACMGEAYSVAYGPLYIEMVTKFQPKTGIQGIAFFKEDKCGKEPESIMFQGSTQCQNSDCVATGIKGYTTGAKCFQSEAEIFAELSSMYGKIPFVKTDIYSQEGCKGEPMVFVHKANGDCVINPDLKTSTKVKVEKDGSVTYTNYSVTNCDNKKISKKGKVTKSDMEKKVCQEKTWKIQTNIQLVASSKPKLRFL